MPRVKSWPRFIIEIVLSFILPPLAVALADGIGTHLLVNLVLLVAGGVIAVMTLGMIPAVIFAIIHALWVVLEKHGAEIPELPK